MPRFSILTIAYKSANYLNRLFDCLHAQTNRDFEIILIDNASPEFKITETQTERANIFVQNTQNTGFACANNQGAKLAKGEWLILLNPDAFPEKNWLEEISIAIDNYPDCENFGCLQKLDGENGILDGAGDCFSIFGIAWRGGHRKPIPENLKDGEAFAACGAASVWKKSRYQELGGFEESFGSYYEDVDLGFRHRLMGGKCIQLANAIVSHMGSASSSRYSEYAVFHGVRNRELAYIRLMPDLLFWLFLPLHLSAVLGLWFHAFLRKCETPYRKAIFAAFKGLNEAWRARKLIQEKRSTSLGEILGIMSFSPFSLLKRAIILRRIK